MTACHISAGDALPLHIVEVYLEIGQPEHVKFVNVGLAGQVYALQVIIVAIRLRLVRQVRRLPRGDVQLLQVHIAGRVAAPVDKVAAHIRVREDE